MAVFNSNGTVTLLLGDGGGGIAVGSWVSTANGQFALTTNQFKYDDKGNYARNDKARISLSVSGNQMSGNVEIVISDPTGAVQGSIPGITLTASPIAVETIGSM
jgi:hypothetical protein